MEGYRNVFIEIHNKMGKEDLKGFSYLAKDFIHNRDRKEMKSALDIFTALEKRGAIHIKCTEGRKPRFEFLNDCFLLMKRMDLVRILRADSLDGLQLTVGLTESNFLDEKRKLLYRIGEETGRYELNALKESLSVHGVGKRVLGQVDDVWECLDLLEETMEDGELFSLLRTVYNEDDKVPGLLEDFIRGSVTAGATGGQTDRVPVQEEGEEECPFPQSQTERRESQELTFGAPPSGISTMTLDGAPSGISTSQSSRLGVYDRGRRPGCCIIFNNETFLNENTHPTRCGTNVDRDKLEYLFKNLFGFDVHVYNNKSCDEILEILREFQSRDHRDYGAFVVCTLTHGDLNVVSGACGQSIAITSMTSLFRSDNCPTLAGKPKIFIYQACQGRDSQNVWHQTHTTEDAENDTHLMIGTPEVTPELPHSHPLPLTSAEADFLIAHSTMPGYVSHRNENGSFFIQSLVRHIKIHSPREDLVSILVEVNGDVSRTIGRTTGGQLAVQIPEPKVRLTKKLYLCPVESEV